MGDFGNGDVGDVPGAFLDGVEDRQEGTGGVLLALQHAVDQGQVKRLVRHTAFLCFTDDVDKRSSGGLGCGAPATHGNVALLVAVLASRRASERACPGHSRSLPLPPAGGCTPATLRVLKPTMGGAAGIRAPVPSL
ncbi:hypothetical protein D9M70_567480 [compost metagenome]